MPSFSAELLANVPSPAAVVQPTWQTFIGCFTPDVIEAALDQQGPVLLVPNHPDYAEEMKVVYAELNHERLHYSEQLLGPQDGEMAWHRYTDPRFDGLIAPGEVQRLVPNLGLLELRLAPIQRLDTLVLDWARQDLQLRSRVMAGSGQVWLHCKHPSFILAGAEHLVELIDEFHWLPLGALGETAQQGEQGFSQWLQPCPFQRVVEPSQPSDSPADSPSDSPVVWRQDPWLRSLRRQSRLEGDLAQTRQQCQQLAAERDQLLAQAKALSQEQQSMRERCAFLRSWPESPTPQNGDLKLCSDPADPRLGSLLMLVSQPGEPEVWEVANVVGEAGGGDPSA